MIHQPPKVIRYFLKSIISEELFDDIDGDLMEMFNDRVATIGLNKARAFYAKDVLFSIRNIALRRKLKYFNSLVMYKSYVKISLRNLLNHKLYSIINIAGLALGMAACLLIILFVQNEKSFDDFHQKKELIYRLNEVQTFDNLSQKVALSMFPMGPAIVNDYPEVVNFTRFWSLGKILLEKGDQRYYLDEAVRVDTSFLQMFDFELLRGDEKDLFSDGHHLVLTQSAAERVFGDQDPIGQNITLSEKEQFVVSGVIMDVPEQSHLQFEALLPMTLWDNSENQNNWGGNSLNTYLQLAPHVDVDGLERKFDDFLVTHINEDILDVYELFLQPLSDIHLGSTEITHDYYNHKKFSSASVNIFILLAFFVLLIASVNFMNLSTAAVANRSKEVGVRKSIGAYKIQISSQFIVQSFLLTFLALGIAIIICLVSMPTLNNMIDRELSLSSYLTPFWLMVIFLITVLIALFSGFYPALVMSNFNVITALKGGNIKQEKSAFRNTLVVLQYSIAISVIIGTSVVVRQLNFMQTMDLGFDKDRIIVLPMFYNTNQKYELLKSELESQSNVVSVTATTQRLGNNLHQAGLKYRGDSALVEGVSSFVQVDPDFIELYDIEVVNGRSFNPDYIQDREGQSFIVNRTLADMISQNAEEVIGTRFHFLGADSLGTIVGVVEDFKYNKLTNFVEPLFINARSQSNWWSETNVKIRGNDVKKAIAEVELVWQNLFPNRPFEYKFLDVHFDNLYQSEQQLVRIISVLSGLAIIIASLGLFGLSSFMVNQRMKEMGVRKVLGASVYQVLFILSKQFSLLVLVAFCFSAPLTYYFLQSWLNGYAFSISLGLGIFAVVGILCWLSAILTVGGQSLKVALLNPVKVLRNE